MGAAVGLVWSALLWFRDWSDQCFVNGICAPRTSGKNKRFLLREQSEARLIHDIRPVTIIQHNLRILTHIDLPTQLAGAIVHEVLANEHTLRVIGKTVARLSCDGSADHMQALPFLLALSEYSKTSACLMSGVPSPKVG